LRGCVKDRRAPNVCLAAGIGQHGEARAPIGGVGRAAHEAVRLEAIDELRDIRLHARQTVRELPEGE
jgi:hypothetical protein